LGFPTFAEERDFEEEESYDSDESDFEEDDSGSGCEMEESFAPHDVPILVPKMPAARAGMTQMSADQVLNFTKLATAS